jgi:hypothetical protein
VITNVQIIKEHNVAQQILKFIALLPRQALILLVCVLPLVGCGSTSVKVDSTDVFENEYARFSPPDNWLASKNANWIYEYHGTQSENNKNQWIVLKSRDSLSTIVVSFESYPEWNNNLKKIDEKAFLHAFYNERSEEEIKYDKMASILIRDAWVSYLVNVQCINDTYTGGMVWKKGQFLFKNSIFRCRYYDSVEKDFNGQRIFSIEYRFLTSDGGNEDILNAREHELINAVKTIMSNLQIKNMDVERMKREGLYFESQPFFVPEHALLPL